MEQHFKMIDVGGKPSTHRKAVAQGRISMGAEAYALLKQNRIPKGDVLALAEVAGILSAKKAHDVIPLCHPLGLDQVGVECTPQDETCSVLVRCTASAFAKTGVEMEALAGVSGALLAIYDLVKAVDAALSISDIRLNTKEGGKSGMWTHPMDAAGKGSVPEKKSEQKKSALSGVRAAVLTVSDRAHSGEYEDRSGPELCRVLAESGAEIAASRCVPDDRDAIETAFKELSAKAELVVSTGGTGLGPRDVTPEALQAVCTRLAPGFGELLRQSSSAITSNAWLSRALAGIRENSLLIALPGSPKAVVESVAALKGVLPHALRMLKGDRHGG